MEKTQQNLVPPSLALKQSSMWVLLQAYCKLRLKVKHLGFSYQDKGQTGYRMRKQVYIVKSIELYSIPSIWFLGFMRDAERSTEIVVGFVILVIILPSQGFSEKKKLLWFKTLNYSSALTGKY